MSQRTHTVSSAANFSIAIVNYKTAALTKTCLTLLREQLRGYNVPVWVVDNNSADDSTAYLRGVRWINLLERTPEPGEPGHVAHGRALDLVLEHCDTEHLLLLHTDTFIYDKQVFDLLLTRMKQQPNLAAVGCVEQLDRGALRSHWRLTSRYIKHYYRRAARAVGLSARDPKPWREQYLKSFCTLWNSRAMKANGLHFCMDERVPGYTLQDRMVALGYGVDCVAPGRLFKYLDHIQAGTVSAQGGYTTGHRRTRMYQQAMAKVPQALAQG